MRIFLSEFVCGGGWPEREIHASLAREGEAMLRAVVEDFSRIDGVRVTTTWDARLGPPPFDNVHTIVVDSSDDEPAVFRELAQLCDATLVIAPETGGIFEQRCLIAEGVAARLLGPGSSAVQICTSKMRTAECLRSANVPVIGCHWLPASGTRTNPSPLSLDGRGVGGEGDLAGRFPPKILSLPPSWGKGRGLGGERRLTSAVAARDTDARPNCFPIVIKPDDGAGSQDTYLVRDADELQRFAEQIESREGQGGLIWQPFVPGRPVSVGVLAAGDGERFLAFPPAEQTLSDDGRFQYLGGVIPARGVDLAAIQSVARAACSAVPGLRGYVGVDLVVPDATPDRPLVIEVNPRLTTSYAGYRRLGTENLAARMLHPGTDEPIRWREETISFNSDGSAADRAEPRVARYAVNPFAWWAT